MGILPIFKKHFLLLVELCKGVCEIDGHEVYEIEKVIFLPFEPAEAEKDFEGNNEQGTEVMNQKQKIEDIKHYIKVHLLSEGYYFAFRYDLSLSRSSHAAGFPSKKKYFWNYNIGKHFSKLEDSRWFVGVLQGSVRSFKMTLDGTLLLRQAAS
jgi:hypothetical protein